jgi:AraC-like DNA-binding protein
MVASSGMTVFSMRPSPALAPYVHHFGLRVASLGVEHLYTALPARSDCFLEFYLADRYQIVDVSTRAVHRSPRVALVGPHTRRREDLILSGTLQVFHIHFTATGFRQLFGIPAERIANAAESAEAILGRGVLELAEQLAALNEPAQLVAVAERYLMARLPDAAGPAARVAAIVRLLERSHGKAEIAPLAAAHGLTVRHLERVFAEYVGVSPKIFARLARLSRALTLYEREPPGQWAGVALAAGFYDQSHLVRDFQALTGETPVGFVALRRRAAKFSVAPASAGDVAFVLSPPAGSS